MRVSPLLLVAAACNGGHTTTDRRTRDTSETGTAVAPWGWAIPDLDGDELVPGHAARLWIEDLPAMAAVTFYQSTSGLVPAPCDVDTHNCAAIADPQEVATGQADVYGSVEWSHDVEPDEPPAVVYYQALATDPATGASAWSYPIQRHVAIPPDRASISLVDATQDAGINVFTYGNSHTGGVAWPDYNGDLLPDLLIANGTGLNHRLYRNDGDGTFTDVSHLIDKPDGALEDAAPLFADLDGDGDVDLLFVVDSPVNMDSETVQPREGGPNLLYVNNGDGTFTEDALARGIVDPRGWRDITGVAADFDADGDVDLHLGSWAMNQTPESDRWGRLLLNDGTGHFVDSGQQLGYGRDVLTSLAADLDGDGWTDLYLGNVNKITGFLGSNPLADDVLYENDGAGALVDATPSSPGVGDDAWAAMGLDVGDVDNDGDFDLYETDRWEVADTLPRGNPFYLNNGDGTFTDDVCDVAGICTGYASWPAQFADFDRDGFVDLWVGTGKEWYPDLIYVNNGNGTFWSHYVPTLVDNAARGSAVADYDGDGAVDLFVWNLGAKSRLYRNRPKDSHHWVEVALIGHRSNRLGLGAVVRVSTGAVTQMRRISGGDGAHSQSEAVAHFGLGTSSQPVSIDVTWPGGRHQQVAGVPVDRLVQVDEDAGVVPYALVDASATWSTATRTLTVSTRTSYGGRVHLSTPYGPIAWDPDALRFSTAFADLDQPATLDVSDDHGDHFSVPVTVTP